MSKIDDLAVLAFQGKDAGVFLHNQLTADIQALEPGACTFAALCQPKGRVMALLLVQRTEGGYRVLCHDSLADRLLEYLVRFRFREKVTMERETDVAVLWGSSAAQATDAAQLRPFDPVVYAVVPTASTDQALAPAADQAPAGHAHAEALAAGIAWLDQDSTEQFLPQMLGLEAIGALNFRKGCFPGQEVIARTHYLGKLKRHPWTGRVKTPVAVPTLGAVTLSGPDGEASGVLVASAPFADGTQQLFLVARRPGAITVDTLQADDEPVAVLDGHWLSPEDKETPGTDAD